jgi:hypothetical protein
MISLKTLLLEKKKTGAKIHRDAFIYLDPKGNKNDFAQCSSCSMWTGAKCMILGNTKVTGTMSCSFYIHGIPPKNKAGKEEALVTAKEAGLVDRKVRCENCRSFDDGKCLLFESLNKSNSDVFDLDEKVDKHGCCNAQMPK